jgi:hypothetical protein
VGAGGNRGGGGGGGENVVAGAVVVGGDVEVEVEVDAATVVELLAISAVDETSGSGDVPADSPQPAARPSATTNMATRYSFIVRR